VAEPGTCLLFPRQRTIRTPLSVGVFVINVRNIQYLVNEIASYNQSG